MVLLDFDQFGKSPDGLVQKVFLEIIHMYKVTRLHFVRKIKLAFVHVIEQ